MNHNIFREVDMVWLGTALKGAYNKFAATERSAWGDGLSDLSLPTLWYRCSWDTVADDELALLIPSLASDGWSAERDTFGPKMYLYRALCVRLRWAVMSLTSAHCSAEQTLDAIARCNVISTVNPNEAWADGHKYFALFYGAPPKVQSPQRLEADSETHRAIWQYELAILACLDRLLDDASLGRETPPLSSEFDSQVDISDVLIASIYASFNGAYVYSQFTAYHQMFTVGAWLGYLMRDRAALMPVFIAEYLVDRFGDAEYRSDAECSHCDRLLRYHADLVISRERLLKVARRVAASGRPVKVHRKAPTARNLSAPNVLDGLISKRLRERLSHCSVVNYSSLEYR